MTEIRLPQELEEQAALYALGVLEPDDHRTFAVRLRGGESLPLQQATTTYRAVVEALAWAVVPATPRPTLRTRIVNQVADETVRETAQFEGAANTLALNAVTVASRASLRERLLARVEGHTDVRLDSLKSLIFVKASEGVWQAMAPASQDGFALARIVGETRELGPNPDGRLLARGDDALIGCGARRAVG